jgi:hypothetical protein
MIIYIFNSNVLVFAYQQWIDMMIFYLNICKNIWIIHEIVISDENGNDNKKIRKYFIR